MNDSLLVEMVIIFVLGMIILVVIGARAEARRRIDLDLHGRTVTATITSIRGDGENGSYATAEWMNPLTGAISSFEGSSPEDRTGASVQVVFDPHNPRNCYFRRWTPEGLERQEKAYRDALKYLDSLRSGSRWK